MSLILDGSAGVTFPNSTVQASSGVVLQVVSATYSTATSTTSTTAVTTGLTASITPKFSTSKILIISCLGDQATSAQANGNSLFLYKNGASIGQFGSNQGYITSGGGLSILPSQAICYIDSPATTSSTTYAMYFASRFGSSTATVMYANTLASIILMEIAA